MQASRLLLLVLVVGATSEPSGSAEELCDPSDVEHRYLSVGEALYYVPFFQRSTEESQKQNLTWTRRTRDKEEDVPTEENQSLYSRGNAFFLFSAEPNDSGSYTATGYSPSGEQFVYCAEIEVLKVNDEKLLYGKIENSDQNKRIECPEPIIFTCKQLRGDFSWRNVRVETNSPLGSKSITDQHGSELRITAAGEADEGVYTCVCSWTHGGVEYKSLGSTRLQLGEGTQHRDPEIIFPTNKQQFAEKGVGIKLNCSIACGSNVDQNDCRANWHRDGVLLSQVPGYIQTIETVPEDRARNTIFKAVLTIDKVSAEDFNVVFVCKGAGRFQSVNATLTLKRRESVIPLVVGGVCALFLCVFAAALVKWFAIDIVLFFRPCFQFSRCNKDGRMFDAYVVYQTQSEDKVAEVALTQFIAQILPSVLEEKCGYRLFIHGRDDTPGEDRLELVEGRMKQSRRLMVILPPGSGPESESAVSLQPPVIGGYDWQVGLHHALLQREMSVILVQLGDVGPRGYSHLPAGLQHLILKSAPVRWREEAPGAASGSSRFWKRVRYLMPATPAKRCPPSAVIEPWRAPAGLPGLMRNGACAKREAPTQCFFF
uniref:Uncharacterized protein n=1 Tax=Gasterosteus aculeatus aculeatus TaxID=481459 RepID=G3N8U6_GASAC